MVSVEPAITDAVLPIKLSGEKLLNKSFNKANEPLPDTGLISASGKISLGNPNALVTGDNKSVNISKNLMPLTLIPPLSKLLTKVLSKT